MDLTTETEIDASRDRVFALLTDFDLIEGRLAGHGVHVTRAPTPGPGPEGTAWQAAFKVRGVDRTATVTLAEAAPPERLVFAGRSGGLETETTLSLVAVAPTTTRLAVRADLKPGTLSARLLVQSLKLARARIDARFAARIDTLAAEIGRHLNAG